VTAAHAFGSITLRTERLILRPLRQVDANELFAIFSDARVSRYLSHPPWTHIDSAHELIARTIESVNAGKYAYFGIEQMQDGRLIGECSLFNLMPQCRRAEVGYTLAHEAWGKGYIGEALVTLLEFGFTQLELNRVEADVDPRNVASARALERLGFEREGLLRERWIVDGEVSDSALYGLLARDWKVKRG
jgi:[ribosomal protein S5]-alanine N-acetyltransferase